MGMVAKSSIVPCRCSSDQRRIPMAGATKAKSQGWKLKNDRVKDASPASMKPPRVKDSMLANTVKTTTQT